MKKTVQELSADLKKLFPDAMPDAAITLLEDLNDSVTESGTPDQLKEIERLKKKRDDLDKQWREKYTNRFLNGAEPEPTKPDDNAAGGADPDTPEDEKVLTFDALFKVKE